MNGMGSHPMSFSNKAICNFKGFTALIILPLLVVQARGEIIFREDFLGGTLNPNVWETVTPAGDAIK